MANNLKYMSLLDSGMIKSRDTIARQHVVGGDKAAARSMLASK